MGVKLLRFQIDTLQVLAIYMYMQLARETQHKRNLCVCSSYDCLIAVVFNPRVRLIYRGTIFIDTPKQILLTIRGIS